MKTEPEVAAEAGVEGAVSPNSNVSPDRGLHDIVIFPLILSPCMSTPSSSNVALPSTMSVADTVKLTLAPSGPVASTTMSSGTVMIGGVVSCTVTVNDAVAVLPASSVAAHCTTVSPIGNVEPEGGSQTIVMLPPTLSCMSILFLSNVALPSTTSVADTVKLTLAPSGPVASTTMSSGTVMIGGVVSCTVTVNDAVAVLPASSVAAHCTTVSPIGNVEPEGGSQTIVMLPPTLSCMSILFLSNVALPSTTSVADTVKLTLAPSGP